MQFSKLLITLGSAIASTRLARGVSSYDINDLLGVVGLSRRESHLGRGILLFGGGALAGAGVALLLAPDSGRNTRKMLSARLDKLTDAASDTLRDLQEEVPALLGREPASHVPGQQNQRKTSNQDVAHSSS